MSTDLCTLAWLIASFLPLPAKPDAIPEDDVESQLEMTLRMRLFDLETRRHENARWWRNLNRWMNPLGLVIITIVVCSLSSFPLTIRCSCFRRSPWLLWVPQSASRPVTSGFYSVSMSPSSCALLSMTSTIIACTIIPPPLIHALSRRLCRRLFSIGSIFAFTVRSRFLHLYPPSSFACYLPHIPLRA